MSLASAFISAFTSYPLSLCCWLIYGHGFVDKHTLKKKQKERKKALEIEEGKNKTSYPKVKARKKWTLIFASCLCDFESVSVCF